MKQVQGAECKVIFLFYFLFFVIFFQYQESEHGNSRDVAKPPRIPKIKSFQELWWKRASPVNLLHIFRTPFPRNTSEWLLLNSLLIVAVNNSLSCLLIIVAKFSILDICGYPGYTSGIMQHEQSIVKIATCEDYSKIQM